MGYEIPNVVKEVYLPVSDAINVESYKETYGIDLSDIFGKIGEPYKDLSNIKIYLIAEYAYPYVVCPASFKYTDDDTSLFVYCSVIQYQDGESRKIHMGFEITMSNSKIVGYNAFYEEN